MGHTRGNEKGTKSKAASKREQPGAAVPGPSMDRAELRRALLLRRQEIQERIGDSYGAAHGAFTEPGDLGDWASASAETDLGIRIREGEIAELRSIDSALQRMDEGTYGICEDCAKPIASARLLAIPNAVQCLECKMAREGQRARGRRTPQRGQRSVLNSLAIYVNELSDD